VSAARDYVLAAACRRHGVPAAEGRGIDQLPAEVSGPLRGALVTRLDAEEIVRAFGVAVDALLDEARHSDAALAAHIEPALRDLVQSTRVAASSSS